MNMELDSILEQSLSQIAAGKARVESSLLSYPEMADQLKPLLLAAQKLGSIPKPTLSPEAKAQMESRLLAAAAASPLLRPVGPQRKPIVVPRWGWIISALAAVLVFVLLMAATMVNVSADASPGTPLYPVKRAVENAWVWVAPAHDEPELHLRFARRRLAEIQTLARQGRFDASLLEDMTAEIEAVVTGAETLPPDIALPVLDELAVLLNDQQQTLSVLLAQVSASSRSAVVAALRDVVAQVTRVDMLRRALLPSTPVVSPEASPTGSDALAATETEAALRTPTPTGTRESNLSPTGTLTPLPTPEATAVMVPEPSQAPTAMQPVVPTDTKVPPGQTKIPPGQTKTPEPPGQTKTPRP